MKLNKISIFVCSVIILVVAGAAFFSFPLYQNYKLERNLARIKPDLEIILQQAVAFTKEHGQLPATDSHELRNLDLRYVYRIKNWASDPSHMHTAMGQTGYIQGFINGRALGLAPGTGGMFTCLLANRKVQVVTSCMYQIKQS